MCITEPALLGQVFDGLRFPAQRWQLFAQALAFGADADTCHHLASLPHTTYADLDHLAATLHDHNTSLPADLAPPVPAPRPSPLTAPPAHRRLAPTPLEIRAHT